MTGDGRHLLTGPDAGELLGAAVTSGGGRLLSWAPLRVDSRPAGGATASYRCRVHWPRGEAPETLCASTRPMPRSPGVVTVSDGANDVAVWCFPADPLLPGLATAWDPGALAGLLGSLGVTGDVPTRALRTYRPTRRAVLAVEHGGVPLYVKVVRPGRVRALHERHVLLHEAGVPVPRSLGWSADGLLVLEALPGQPMRTALREHGPLPRADDVLDLLRRLPPRVTELPPRPSWSASAGHYAALLGSVLPEQAPRAAALAGALDERLAQDADEPCHGDLYETQLLLAHGRITGLLDVDSAGPGRRADDLGCVLGHLAVLAEREPGHARRTRALVADWCTAFDRAVDPAELRWRAAGVTLSLATGPYRVQEDGWPAETQRRLRLAERWAQAGDDGHGVPV